MRGWIYLLALLISLAGAIYFGARGVPVAAVLMLFPGYLVFAYLMILISTFLPGREKRRYQEARAGAVGTSPQRSTAQGTAVHPAYLGALTSAAYSGDGFLGWPQGGDLVFRSATVNPSTLLYSPRSFRGFKVEVNTPEFLTGSLIEAEGDGGAVVRLEGDSSTMMVQIWLQPDDAASFVARLRAEGVTELD